MTREEVLLKLLAKLSKKYIDGRVIYWEFEAAARRELGIDHNTFWDLVEGLVEEGKIESELSNDKIDVYFKPKKR